MSVQTSIASRGSDFERVIEGSFVLEIDCGTGTILSSSSGIKDILGWKQDSITEKCVSCLVHPDDVDDFLLYCRCPFDQLYELPQLTNGSVELRVVNNTDTVSFLTRMKYKNEDDDGDCSYSIVRVVGKTSSNHPSVQNVFMSTVTAPPISCRYEVAPSLNLDLVEYMITTDHNTRVNYVDPRVQRILGYSQSDVIGKPGYNFVLSDDILFIVAAQFDTVMRKREPRPVVARLKTRNGRMVLSRTRCYINKDPWTKQVKSYVNVTSIISKRSAYLHFNQQIRTVERLRRNRKTWKDILKKLDLTEEQKETLTNMDLRSYLRYVAELEHGDEDESPPHLFPPSSPCTITELPDEYDNKEISHPSSSEPSLLPPPSTGDEHSGSPDPVTEAPALEEYEELDRDGVDPSQFYPSILTREFKISRMPLGDSHTFLIESKLNIPRRDLRNDYGCYDSNSTCAQLLSLATPVQNARVSRSLSYRMHLSHLSALRTSSCMALASVRIPEDPPACKTPTSRKRPQKNSQFAVYHSRLSQPARKRGRPPSSHCSK